MGVLSHTLRVVTEEITEAEGWDTGAGRKRGQLGSRLRAQGGGLRHSTGEGTKTGWATPRRRITLVTSTFNTEKNMLRMQ